ncbi:MAG: hypothetical protein WAU91_09185 [Desulfatitalea sp.]
MFASPHSFHIPVMGTGFTLDTPLRVARYGISSVISLVDDVIIEQARKFHCHKSGEPYEAITAGQPDARARRITAYLNLVDRLVQEQMRHLKTTPFETGSEISRYFELLPPSPLREAYQRMLAANDPLEKKRLQDDLRGRVTAGSIDVNIMTKLDAEHYENGNKLPAEFADGMAALRGFALSTSRSAMVFSAGINQRLYTYAAQFDDFFPDDLGTSKKRIILKVSDYRSALIQGKFLAKRGLWVSEFRIESGLNCGGHAFAAECNLIGPVLEQFKLNRDQLAESLFTIYRKALADLGRPAPAQPAKIRITVQGGIGTAYENSFLLRYYQVDSTGWGTPFMVVPEVTNVDPEHLEKLCNARREDIYLSNASPLGVPFWNLRTSASEEKRRQRIAAGKPGSPCPKGYITVNSEFSEKPICTASREYIKKKLAHLPEEGLTEEQMAFVREEVLDKSCICHDLGGSITIKQNGGANAAPALCCGPNIRYFNRIFSLDEMINHIYGRLCLMVNKERPHMFVEEMRLNLEYLKVEIKRFSYRLSNRPQSFFENFKKSLLDGIDYYQELTKQFIEEHREKFLEDLKRLHEEIEGTGLPKKC